MNVTQEKFVNTMKSVLYISIALLEFECCKFCPFMTMDIYLFLSQLSEINNGYPAVYYHKTSENWDN